MKAACIIQMMAAGATVLCLADSRIMLPSATSAQAPWMGITSASALSAVQDAGNAPDVQDGPPGVAASSSQAGDAGEIRREIPVGPWWRALSDSMPSAAQDAGNAPDARMQAPWTPTSPGDMATLDAMDRRAIEMRRTYGPQLVATNSNQSDSAEEIWRETLAGWIPVNMQLDLNAIFEQDLYHTRGSGTISTALTRLTVRPVWQLDPRTDAWLALTPYDGPTANGLGGAVGMDWQPRDGWLIQSQLMAHEPWDESTYSVYYDGYLYGATALVRMPVTERLSLTVNGVAEWYYLGQQSSAGAGYYGRDLEGGVEADYLLYRGLGRTMGMGFRDRHGLLDQGLSAGPITYLNEGGLSEGLITYAALQRKDVTFGTDNTVVPVIASSLDMRLGAEYTHVFSAHWGAVVDGYFGSDPDRGAQFGQLYGAFARLVFVPSDRLRLWAGMEVDSESTTGAPTGRTTLVECGLNIAF